MSAVRLVLKFGGTSLATPARIESAADRVIEVRESGALVAVVVSAMARETDRLLGLARSVGGATASARELDVIASTGEQVSAGLFALALQRRAVKARSFLAHQLPIVTDESFGSAQIVAVRAEGLLTAFDEGVVPIVAGFQGQGPEGDVTTLGRGGSDTTAVAVAAALDGECEILTDVDGVYTIDPRVSSAGRLLPVIGHRTMHALARAGAKVLEARSIELAAHHRVVVHVRSSLSRSIGTRLVDESSPAAQHAIGVALLAAPDSEAHIDITIIGAQLAADAPARAAAALRCASLATGVVAVVPGGFVCRMPRALAARAADVLHRELVLSSASGPAPAPAHSSFSLDTKRALDVHTSAACGGLR